MRLNDHDEDRDECTLVLIEILAFLALQDTEAREYLSWLDTDGRLTQAAIHELAKAGITPVDGYKPMASLSMASNGIYTSYWNDPASLISQQVATATTNFQIRIAVSRIRRILEVLNWLYWRPMNPPECEGDWKLLRLYRRYQQQLGDVAIHSSVFNTESFLVNPLWQSARTNARRIMELLGMAGCKPTWDIYRLSMEFEG